MEDKRVLIDTSILVDFFRKKDKTRSAFWSIIDKFDCNISTITLFEIYNGATDEDKMRELELVLDWLGVTDFDSSCAKLSSKIYLDLRRKNRVIEFRDIFIAATAISKDIPLATLNFKHFENVRDIKLLRN